MSYLFHHHHQFMLVDQHQKSGVFCQFFTPHPSKPIPVASNNTHAYSSLMTEDQELYIAAMPDAFHLNLHHLEGSHFTTKRLINNATSHYELSYPTLYTLDQKLYITYLSHQQNSMTYNFVQENLISPNLTTLYTLQQLPSLVKCFSPAPDLTYLFFMIKDTHYELYALRLTSHDTTLCHYLTSPVPIIDYSICCHDQIMHITYVAEIHGKYQLCYFNQSSQMITQLMTTLLPAAPVIFYYDDCLWLNVLLDHELKIMVSVDEGQHFSIPVRSSLQNNIKRCYFCSNTPKSLSAFELYASLSSNLKLCTIALIDIDHLHSDTFVAPEMELLLEALRLHNSYEPSLPPAPQEKVQSKPASSKTSLENAKKAFMDSLSGWDLPPRI